MAALVPYDLFNELERLTPRGKKIVLTLLGYKNTEVKSLRIKDINTLLLKKRQQIDENIFIEVDKKIRSQLKIGSKQDYIYKGKNNNGMRDWSKFIATLKTSIRKESYFGSNDNGDNNFASNNNFVTPPRKTTRSDFGNSPSGQSPYRGDQPTNEAIAEGLRRQEIAQMDAIEEPGIGLSPSFDPKAYIRSEEDVFEEMFDDLAGMSDGAPDGARSDSDTDMEDFGQDPYRLCPSCVTGLCDTHIQLRF